MRNIYDDSEDMAASYLAQIKKVRLLTAEEEIALSRAVKKGNMAARDKLVNANLRLVVKIAGTYRYPDVSLMDLIQEGNMGLVRAAEKFDEAKNVRFATYAALWIKQSISRFISTKRRAIKLPVRKDEILKRVRWTYTYLQQKLSRAPTQEEIAEEAGLQESEVRFVVGMSGDNMISLDVLTGQDDAAPMGQSCGTYSYSPEEIFFRESAQKEARKFLASRLPEKEKNVLMYRYQFNGSREPQSLVQIGERIGMSAESVRQIEIRALNKIRPDAQKYAECMYA